MTTVPQFLAAASRIPPLRAPYNFVPLNARVLVSPWGQDGPDHGTPHKDGLCGALEVKWQVETPLLVGGADNNAPFQLGAGGPYAIPGASLRGMIRSVLEILSYSHIEYYEDQRFSLRDYDAVTWRNVVRATSGRSQTLPNGRVVPLPFTGWLQKNGDAYQLTPCNAVDVPIADLVAVLGIFETDWHCASLHTRHSMLNGAGLSGVINLGLVSTGLARHNGTLVVAGLIKSVVSGAGTNKQREVAFLVPPTATTAAPISKAAFEAFAAVQVVDGALHPPPPEENWSFWEPKLLAGQSIPVFYRGDPAKAASGVPKPTEFVMALTRLMRVPHSLTTSDVVKRTQRSALSPTQLDFVQALFGYVPPEDVTAAKPRGRERGWRSRVRFGIATLAGGQVAARLPPRRAVTMKPRASFYPFYLRPKPNPNAAETVRHPVDWSSADAMLAGRKRYPPRDAAREDLPLAPRGNNEEHNAELENDLVFLQATRNSPLVFRSTIRFHNLLPAELGGLIWAIGLCRPGGNETRRLRHMLGRAKGFGYGQLKAEIASVAIEPNAVGQPKALGDYAEDFETWVNGHLNHAGAFPTLPEVAALLALCDADLGANVATALSYPQAGLAGDEAERILAAYSTIKKITACGPNAQHGEWRGNQPISRNPADDAFLFLPEYPLS